MENQALFSLKDKSKKLKCRLLQFLFGILRINSANCITWKLRDTHIGKNLLLSGTKFFLLRVHENSSKVGDMPILSIYLFPLSFSEDCQSY